jgi:hypothetical protein
MRSDSRVWGRPFRLTVLALVLTAAAGCGSGKLSPVRGKIVFKDGTALAGGLVRFRAVDQTLQVSPRGDIQPDGTFVVGTYQVSDGVIPGKYEVAITPPPRRKVREKPVEGPIIHPRFENFETSGLEVEVKRGKNDFTIEVDKS